MLRVLLALLFALTGLPPVVASAAAISPLHEDCCCCCTMGHEAGPTAPAEPSLTGNPCDCGCLTPLPSPDERPEAPRDRIGSSTVSLPAMQAATAPSLANTRQLECTLRISTAPLRGPPDPSALCVWQE